jgi:hypothetical protein
MLTSLHGSPILKQVQAGFYPKSGNSARLQTARAEILSGVVRGVAVYESLREKRSKGVKLSHAPARAPSLHYSGPIWTSPVPPLCANSRIPHRSKTVHLFDNFVVQCELPGHHCRSRKRRYLSYRFLFT